MKIIKTHSSQIIMSNPDSKHRYFAWPTVARLQNGKIAVVASGFRLRHVCPFGKTVIAYSEDDGESYTAPAPVIDTPLDDRDGGVVPFGKSNVIVTSFNHNSAFQRTKTDISEYSLAYLDTVTPEDEERYLGSTFRISHDCGVTFGEIKKSPIFSPHGPLELPDGTLLWVGRNYIPKNTSITGKDCISAYRLDEDGNFELLGEIENVTAEDGTELLSCEPHSILLEDGRILTHIRVQKKTKEEEPMLTIYQSISSDSGKTWSKPQRLLPLMGGSPPHIIRHSSGVLICTYGYRSRPYGIRAMFSYDNGKTWDTSGYEIWQGINWDLGYPSTVELNDGSLATVFYAWQDENIPAVIMQQKWRFEK